MIEPIMFFGIGFLVASLFGLVLIPLVHNRAARLTMRRLEAATPLSMAEIQADKDQLRAEFAMSTRRLELSVDQIKAKATGQLAELGKKADAVNRLKVELGEKTAAIFSLEAREKSLKDQLQATEAEHAMKVGALREAERLLAEKQTEFSKVTAELDAKTVTNDSQRVELVALRAQADALKDRVSKYERDTQDITDRLNREREAATTVSAELDAERAKGTKLGERIEQLERLLATQTTQTETLTQQTAELETNLAEQIRLLDAERAKGTKLGEQADQLERLLATQTNQTETLTQRTAGLEAKLADQVRQLTERELESSQLRAKIVVAEKAGTDLLAELESSSNRARSAADAFTSEKAQLENEVAQAKAEREKYQQQIINLKQEAEQSWAAERVENALLRERINDVAAEIARLTVALEGADSPVEALLAGEPAAGGATPRTVKGERKPKAEGKGNLADRIRALQLKASRVPTTS